MATSATVNRLTDRHRAILELCLRGLTTEQIAAHFDLSTVRVSAIRNSPTFQHELALRREKLEDLSNHAIVASDETVASYIRQKTIDAAKRLGAIVDDKGAKDSDAIRACEAILDRGGQPRVQRNEDRSVILNISSDDVARLTETLGMLPSIDDQPLIVKEGAVESSADSQPDSATA